MNSPMKFDEPGIARFAKVTIRNSVASTGARNAIPPMSSRLSLPPARAASGRDDEERGGRHDPWLTICSSAPWPPSARQREDPERDEAELRDARVGDDEPRILGCERDRGRPQDRDQRDHQHQPLVMPRRVREQRQHDPQEAVGGDLREHAREDRDAGIGIDLYASASQPWNGTSGIFTRNASAKHRKIQSCELCDSGMCASAVKVKFEWPPFWLDASTPVATAATSIRNDPTIV